MKTSFNFNLFALLLSLLLLDLATLHPADEPGADYAIQSAPRAQPRRPVAATRPLHRTTVAVRRR